MGLYLWRVSGSDIVAHEFSHRVCVAVGRGCHRPGTHTSYTLHPEQREMEKLKALSTVDSARVFRIPFVPDAKCRRMSSWPMASASNCNAYTVAKLMSHNVRAGYPP